MGLPSHCLDLGVPTLPFSVGQVSRIPENISGARTDQELVALWLAGRPRSTQKLYRCVADQFLAYIAPASLHDVKVKTVIDWAEGLGGKPSSKATKIKAVKSLLSWAHKTGYLLFNVGLPVKVPKARTALHERILDAPTVQAVIGSADSGRDQILLRFLYASGCRISEALGLRFKDLRGNRCHIWGKGARERTVCVADSVADDLRSLRWSTDQADAFVFKSYRGNPLDPADARRILREAAASVPEQPTPHWLRHAHASHALDNGAPIHLVQKSLGHANVSTTSAYLHCRSTGVSQYLDLGG